MRKRLHAEKRNLGEVVIAIGEENSIIAVCSYRADDKKVLFKVMTFLVKMFDIILIEIIIYNI